MLALKLLLISDETNKIYAFKVELKHFLAGNARYTQYKFNVHNFPWLSVVEDSILIKHGNSDLCEIYIN